MNKSNTGILYTPSNVEKQGNKNSGELEVKNIIVPNSQFSCKWVKDEGYAIGIDNVKITKSFETLEEALNQIGYGVEKDDNEDEILVKVGDIDYELLIRIVKAILIIEEQKIREAVINEMVLPHKDQV